MSSSSSSGRGFVLGAFVLGALALASVVACDDPVKPLEDDGKVKQVLSPGCRAESTSTAKGFQSQTSVVVKGVDRTYDWFVPDAHDGRHPIPVVFVYHGEGSTGAGVRSSFKLEEVILGKALMVYPDIVPRTKSWDLERGAESNADMVFFDQILKTLSDGFCIDTNRVFVTGVDNGGSFANQLGCMRGSSIRAIAVHGGAGPASAEYSLTGTLDCPQRPVGALIVQAGADPAVPVAVGQASRDHWTRVNGCRSGGLEIFDPAPCRNQLNCAKDRPVVYCEVPDLAHSTWAEGPRASWNFFSQF